MIALNRGKLLQSNESFARERERAIILTVAKTISSEIVGQRSNTPSVARWPTIPPGSTTLKLTVESRPPVAVTHDTPEGTYNSPLANWGIRTMSIIDSLPLSFSLAHESFRTSMMPSCF